MKWRALLALWGGPVGFLCALLFIPSGEWGHDAALAGTAWWMLWWWLGGAVPIGPTSLLPLVLFPTMGVLDLGEAAAPFGSRFIWLFLGGFVLALALERHGLHRRFALQLLGRLGGGPRRTLLGFMLATALLSMWISNTATTLMMLPMATAVLGLLSEKQQSIPWGGALILGIAYGANAGGIATLVGTPPNAALAGVAMDRFGVDIGFAEWLSIGLPMSAVLLVTVFLLLVLLHKVPAGSGGETQAVVERERRALGPMSVAEKRVMFLFVSTAALWMLRSPLNMLLGDGLQLNDTSTAVAAAVACFAVSAGRPTTEEPGTRRHMAPRLLAAGDLARLPWDILLLFGGGLALAKGFEAAGWAGTLAAEAAGWGWSPARHAGARDGDGAVCHRTHEQPRLDAAPDPRGRRHGNRDGIEPPVFCGARDPGIELCFHAAHGHATQCHRLCLRADRDVHHGADRVCAQRCRLRLDPAHVVEWGARCLEIAD